MSEKKLGLIPTKGTLDWAYPPFILASTAAALGYSVNVFNSPATPTYSCLFDQILRHALISMTLHPEGPSTICAMVETNSGVTRDCSSSQKIHYQIGDPPPCRGAQSQDKQHQHTPLNNTRWAVFFISQRIHDKSLTFMFYPSPGKTIAEDICF